MQVKHLHIKLNHPQYLCFIASLLFTIIAFVTCLCNSVFTSIFPKYYSISGQNYDAIGSRHAIKCTTGTLYYSGYDYYVRGKAVAHYYYSINDNVCTIFLIENKISGGSDSPALTLENLSFSANIRKGDTYLRQILEYMASDLEWNYYSLSKYTNAYIVSQYHYSMPWMIMMLVLNAIGVLATVYFYISFHREQARGADTDIQQTEADESQEYDGADISNETLPKIKSHSEE